MLLINVVLVQSFAHFTESLFAATLTMFCLTSHFVRSCTRSQSWTFDNLAAVLGTVRAELFADRITSLLLTNIVKALEASMNLFANYIIVP